jgi:antitoxin YefM
MSTIFTTTAARANLYQLIHEVEKSHRPIIITGKHNNAVLISQSDWESIQETLYLSAIPKMRESIKDGLKSSISDCDDKIEW